MVVGTLLLITGVPLLTANVNGSPVPAFKVQLCFVEFLSSKNKFPIVRAPSSVTLTLPVNTSVLKLAVALTPAATTLFVQLAAAGHDPPAMLVQVDVVAGVRSRSCKALIWTL